MKCPRMFSTQIGGMIAVLLLAFFVNPLALSAADDAQVAAGKETDGAVVEMKGWLGSMDAADYAKAWDAAAASFKKALTSEQWVDMSQKVRTPLGKLNDRKLSGAIYQTGMLSATGILPGQFVIAQFTTSFENLKSARETVTFEKESDGTWRASGYYIKPL